MPPETPLPRRSLWTELKYDSWILVKAFWIAISGLWKQLFRRKLVRELAERHRLMAEIRGMNAANNELKLVRRKLGLEK